MHVENPSEGICDTAPRSNLRPAASSVPVYIILKDLECVKRTFKKYMPSTSGVLRILRIRRSQLYALNIVRLLNPASRSHRRRLVG